jgi:hypothetical protein
LRPLSLPGHLHTAALTLIRFDQEEAERRLQSMRHLSVLAYRD